MIACIASLSCPLCGETFSTDLLTYHHVLSTHHLLLCVLCALAFDNEQSLYSHFDCHNHSSESATAQHACGLCGMSFVSEDGLTLHHTVHTIDRKARQHVNKKKKRKVIDGDSPSKKRVKEDDEEGGSADEGEGGNERANRFPPAICSHPSHTTPLCFTSDEDLQSHQSTGHSLFQCFAVDCDTFFPSASALSDHLIRAHVSKSEEAKEAKGGIVPSHCPYCGLVWSKKTPKTEHLHRHVKPFHCVVCTMRFARKTRWRNHVKRKHPNEFKSHAHVFEGVKG